MYALQEEVANLDYAIGDRINTLLHRHSLTRKTFGAKLGIGPSGMSLKIGGRRTWSATEVKIAADILGVKVGVLYGEDPMPDPARPTVVTPLDPSKNAKMRTLDYRAVGSEGLAPVTPIRAAI